MLAAFLCFILAAAADQAEVPVAEEMATEKVPVEETTPELDPLKKPDPSWTKLMHAIQDENVDQFSEALNEQSVEVS